MNHTAVATPPERPLVVVCGWCPDVDQKTRAAELAGFRVTHGICPACVEKFEDLALEGRPR